jgi:Transposase
MTHSEIKSTEFAAYVGIDWADQKHDICLQEAGSNQIESLQLDHKPDSISNWVSHLQERFQGRPIALALEQKRGGLLYSLMHYEFIVLYPVNPKALSSYREAFATSGAKDAPVDADLLRRGIMGSARRQNDRADSLADHRAHRRDGGLRRRLECLH